MSRMTFLSVAAAWHACWVVLSVILSLAAIRTFSGDGAARDATYAAFQSIAVILLYALLALVPNLILATWIWQLQRVLAPPLFVLISALSAAAVWSLLAAAFVPPQAETGADPSVRLQFAIGGAVTGLIYGAFLAAVAGRRREIQDASKGPAPLI